MDTDRIGTGVDTPLPDHLLLFDGGCNLCNGLVQFIIRHDRKRRFRFAALRSMAAQAVLSSHGRPPQALTSLVYCRKGRVFVRSDAALHAARDLGGACQLAFIFILVPRFLRDAVYDLVARNRYRWFGRRGQCIVATAELQDRFLTGTAPAHEPV